MAQSLAVSRADAAPASIAALLSRAGLNLNLFTPGQLFAGDRSIA